MLKQFDLGSGLDTSAHTNVDKCATRATGTLPRERFSPLALSWPVGALWDTSAVGIGKQTLGGRPEPPHRHRARRIRRFGFHLCRHPSGIPLSKIHHVAFDMHLIDIDPDYRLHVSERLARETAPMLEALKTVERREHPLATADAG